MSRNLNNWPNFLNSKPVDKDGNWTPEWQNLMQSFFSFAQTNLSNEGHVMPNQTTSNITTISESTVVPNGTVWHDSDSNMLKVKLQNTVKTIVVM